MSDEPVPVHKSEHFLERVSEIVPAEEARLTVLRANRFAETAPLRYVI